MNPARNRVESTLNPITLDSSGSCSRCTRCIATAAGLSGLLLACLLLAGCGTTRTPPPAQTTTDGQQADADTSAAGDPRDQTVTDLSGETSSTAEPPRGPLGSTTPSGAATAGERDTAASEPLVLAPVGPQDARRGKSITGGGIITEPLRQNFLIRHRIAFLNLQNTEKIYQATEGRMPESHEEYMTEIVEKGGIQLPELDPGWDYYYDATDETLKQRQVQ